MSKLEFKGTKGKWMSDIGIEEYHYDCYRIIIDSNEEDYSPAHAIGRSIEEVEANAALVSAAPDLLEDLQLSTAWLEKIIEAMPQSPIREEIQSGIEKNNRTIYKALNV